jgi:hypothetical protein
MRRLRHLRGNKTEEWNKEEDGEKVRSLHGEVVASLPNLKFEASLPQRWIGQEVFC